MTSIADKERITTAISTGLLQGLAKVLKVDPPPPTPPTINPALKAELLAGLYTAMDAVTAFRNNARTPVVVFCRRSWADTAHLAVLLMPTKLADEVTAAVKAVWTTVLDSGVADDILLTSAVGLKLKREAYTGGLKEKIDVFTELCGWADFSAADGMNESTYVQFHPSKDAPVGICDWDDNDLETTHLLGMRIVAWDL